MKSIPSSTHLEQTSQSISHDYLAQWAQLAAAERTKNDILIKTHMPVYHPMPDEHGKPVLLKKPRKATPLASWSEVIAVVTVTPGGEVPAELNGIRFDDWRNVPTSHEAWNCVEGSVRFSRAGVSTATREDSGGRSRCRRGGWEVLACNAFQWVWWAPNDVYKGAYRR